MTSGGDGTATAEGDGSDPLDDLSRGYVQLGREDTERTLREGTIVLDANVLLNLYRYSPGTREQLLQVLERVGDRLWIPNQSAAEYFRRRANVLTEQLTVVDKLESHIDGSVRSLLDDVRKTQLAASRRELAEDSAERLREQLQAAREEFLAGERSRIPATSLAEDAVHAQLDVVMRGRVGPAFSDERIAEIEREGAARYASKIPPGYMDADKDENAFGDLVMWHQVLDHAERARTSVVFVSDDQKEDWIWTVRGRKLGPRPELVRELWDRAQTHLVIQSTSTFLSSIGAEVDSAVDRAALDEVEDVAGRSNWLAWAGALPESYEGRATEQQPLSAVLDMVVNAYARSSGSSDSLGLATGSSVGIHVLAAAGDSSHGPEARILLQPLVSHPIRVSLTVTTPEGLIHKRRLEIEGVMDGRTIYYPHDFGVAYISHGHHALRVVSRSPVGETESFDLGFEIPGGPEIA